MRGADTVQRLPQGTGVDYKESDMSEMSIEAVAAFIVAGMALWTLYLSSRGPK